MTKLLLLVLTLNQMIFLFAACSTQPEMCPLCRRQIHRAYAAEISTVGHSERTCCIACSMHMLSKDKKAKLLKVSDFQTGQNLDPSTATFLYGPRLRTCEKHPDVMRTENSTVYVHFDRCEPAVLAFKTLDDASLFQKSNGGKLVNIEDVKRLFVVDVTNSP